MGPSTLIINRFIPLILLTMAITQSSFAQDSRLLLPVPIGLPSRGAHGSMWTGEMTAYNAGGRTVSILTSTSLCITTCPPGRWDVAAGETVSIASSVPTMLRVTSNGFADSPLVAMNARVFDISRLSSDHGTEIPIVAETDFRDGTLRLISVPSEPGFRSTLRIYDWDGGEQKIATIRVINQRNGLEIGVRQILLVRQLSAGGFFDFGYAQLDLSEVVPSAAAPDAVRVEIEGTIVPQRLWAFVSVTHNETQRVTLITPQPH